MTKGFKRLLAVLLTLVICLAGVAGLSAQAEETTTKLVPKQVETPVAGTAYKLYLTQAKLNNKVLYLNGEMANTYYFGCTEEASEAVDVYLEAVEGVEGGFYMYYMNGEAKKYIDVVERPDKANSVNVKFLDEPSAVYTYSTELKTMVTTVVGIEWYLGTSGTYTTISASETSKIIGDKASDLGTYRFPASLCTLIEQEVEETPETPEETYVTTLESGDYVIWAPGYNKALSSVKTGYNNFYNAGTDVTLAEEKLSGYTTAEVWTVTKNEDGTYYISQSEKNLGMAASYASMNLEAENDKWVLVDAGDGSYYVKNVNRGSYMQWSTKHTNWSTLDAIEEGTEDTHAVKFTVADEVVEAPEVPEEPANVTTLESGTYVIWAPGYNKALSSNYGGYNNLGVDVALADNVLSGFENSEIWTVTKNEDGTYTISFGEKALGMAASYNSMSLDGEHNVWELYDAGEGLYYVMNVGRKAYMEWYADKNYWSAYGNIADGKEGMFAIQFTPAVAQVEPELPDSPDSGDHSQMILWGAAMVCSAVAVVAIVLKKRNKKA